MTATHANGQNEHMRRQGGEALDRHSRTVFKNDTYTQLGAKGQNICSEQLRLAYQPFHCDFSLWAPTFDMTLPWLPAGRYGSPGFLVLPTTHRFAYPTFDPPNPQGPNCKTRAVLSPVQPAP